MNVDYTKYATGIAVSGKGVIERCPACGRNGERQPGTKKLECRFVHSAHVEPFRSRGKIQNRLVVDARCEIKR